MPRFHRNFIESYLEYSQFSESPENFHFWTAVSCIAGALRRHVWVDMGYFQWTPNFYIVFVAPPGIVSKSTTANIGMNLLREVPGIHFGPEVITWQALIQSLAQSTEGFDYDNLLHSMSTVTIVSSEFGTFLNPSDREMVDVLVSLWDGQIGTWEKATKTMGSDKIINPWINVIACTTPSWIQGNFPEYMIGGGFTSRTIFVYGEEKRKLVAYPGNEMPPEVVEQKRQLVHDLEYISNNLIGPYKLDANAQKWGVEWYDKLYTENKDKYASDRYAGYTARKQTHLHKLAMVLSASENDSLVITREHLYHADKFLTLSEGQMHQVFNRIVSVDARPANLIVDYMRKIKKSSRTALFNALFQHLSKEQLVKGIESGVAAGLLDMYANGEDKYVVYTGREKSAEVTQIPNAGLGER